MNLAAHCVGEAASTKDPEVELARSEARATAERLAQLCRRSGTPLPTLAAAADAASMAASRLAGFARLASR